MLAFYVIVTDTFSSLRRDKIFVPALFVGAFFVLLAYVASSWVFEDQDKIMQDILGFSLVAVGYFVAIFWGVSLIHHGRFSASNEIQLVAPIRRGVWLLGRYFGLVLALALMEMMIVIIWMLTQFILHQFLPTPALVWMVFIHLIAWCIGAAMALMLSIFCRPALALFGSVTLLFCGLLGKELSSNLGTEVLPVVEVCTKSIANIWNLSRFNIVAYDQLTQGNAFYDSSSVVYGICLIGIMLVSASWVFERKDL